MRVQIKLTKILIMNIMADIFNIASLEKKVNNTQRIIK